MRLLSVDLHLVSPNTRSPASEIREVQRMVGTTQDGVYGPITASHVRDWKYRFGFHKNYVNNSLTRAESQWLFGSAKQTANMKLRAAARRQPVTPPLQGTGYKAMQLMQTWASAGYRETKSNYVPQLSKLARAQGLPVGYQNMGWSWCAFATGLSGLAVGSSAYRKFFDGPFNAKLQLYVPQIHAYARTNQYGFKLVGWDQVQPGDLVIYNWDGGVPDHIGRLVSKKDANTLLAVEGNTSIGTVGSQSNGDGVYLRIRSRSLVQAFIREA